MHNDLKGQAPSEALQDWMMEQMAWLRYVLCGLQSTLDEKEVRWPMGRCTKKISSVCFAARKPTQRAKRGANEGYAECSFLHFGSFGLPMKQSIREQRYC
jgi:hypothetical protein